MLVVLLHDQIILILALNAKGNVPASLYLPEGHKSYVYCTYSVHTADFFMGVIKFVKKDLKCINA